jgi:hypothetical protein
MGQDERLIGKSVTLVRRKVLPFVVVWAIFAAYILAARGIRNFFPISAFDMYQAQSPTIASRILVVETSSGQTFEVTDYDGFQCNPAQVKLDDLAHCEHAGAGLIHYVIRDQQIYLDAHIRHDLKDGVAAKLVWRTFKLEDRPGPPQKTDCVLAICQARRSRGTP